MSVDEINKPLIVWTLQNDGGEEGEEDPVLQFETVQQLITRECASPPIVSGKMIEDAGLISRMMGLFMGVIGDINEFDEPASNRIKVAKYEALIECLLHTMDHIEVQGPILSDLKHKLHGTVNREDASLSYLSKMRALFCETAVPELRKAVIQGEPGAQELCFGLFSQNDMHTATEALLQSISHEDKTDLLEDLETFKQDMDHLPSHQTTSPLNRFARSFKDFFDQGFSPAAAGNPFQIFKRMRLFNHLQANAFGSPTIQYWHIPGQQQREAEIDPLFTGYLSALREKEMKHLYVSLQDALSPEWLRISPIRALQSDALLFVACSKNSPFYNGIGHDGNFLEHVHRQFFGAAIEETGCQIPQGYITEEESRALLQALASFLLTEKSSYEEKRALIDFYYALLVTMIAKKSGAHFVSFTCKDAIDRGMQALSEFYLLWLVLSDKDLNGTEVKKLFKETLFTRSFWARKRSILDVRFNAFMQNAKLLLASAKDSNKMTTFRNQMEKIFKIEVMNAAALH